MTRFVIRGLLVISMFCCITVLSGLFTVYAQESAIRVTQADGNVTVNGKPLKEGDVIQRDDKIVTKDKSSVVLTWSNGSILEIYPETSLAVRGVVFEDDRKMEKTLLTLEKGRIFAKAQVPEHLFCHFEIGIQNVALMTQGAEFGVKYEEAEKKITGWSLIGGVIAGTEINKVRIEEGQQATFTVGAKPESAVPMQDKIKEALTKVSKRLGGSLLIEEEIVSAGSPCTCKIGGVKNRRGNAPYTVNFKALIGGGSGKVKSIRWDFGDGESAQGREAQHTFTQGVYAVVLSVEDENGQKSTAQINISVEEQCGC